MEKGERKLSFKTKSGCHRLLAIFIALILVSSFFACLIQTDFGTVKVEHITIDARGAELTAELYYPAGTTGHDSLPAVIVNHGGGCIYGAIKNLAEELARRGFVVINVNAYGSGLSAQPDYDDVDQGINGFYSSVNITDGVKSELPAATPMGMTDALDFLRTLEFVDSTRIGIVGHSMGAYRSNAAAIVDCGYYSLNDIMLNILYNDFGQTFTEEEINEDASSLAAARLNADQLAHYNDLYETEKENYDTRLRSVIILGIGSSSGNDRQTVTVAGHEVSRSLQTNMCFMSGEFDACYNFSVRDDTKAAWYSTNDLDMGSWYIVDDGSASSIINGTLFGTSVTDDSTLSESIQDKTSRIFYITEGETHSKEFFSSKTNTAVVKYFEQTLDYNLGDLGSGNTPLDATSNIWQWRVVFNTIALFSMIGMLVALCGLLVKTEAFKPVFIDIPEENKPVINKKLRWIMGALTVVLSFVSIYYANAKGLFAFGPTHSFPLGRAATIAIVFIGCLAIAALIQLIIYSVINKLKGNSTGLRVVNFGIGFKNFLKSMAIAVILMIAAYASLAVIEYFFGQEYRIWMTEFSEMKADYWYMALRYALILFPMFIIIAAGTNYNVRSDMPEWKDTLITVLVGSVGIWLCCLLNYVIAQNTTFNGTFFSSFICSYQMLTIVPLTVYINRKMYKLTNSIWVGAALCALLISWSFVASLGINDAFYGQTWLGNFLSY